jgi:hypothetical protein
LNLHFSHKQSHPFRVARIQYIPVEFDQRQIC